MPEILWRFSIRQQMRTKVFRLIWSFGSLRLEHWGRQLTVTSWQFSFRFLSSALTLGRVAYENQLVCSYFNCWCYLEGVSDDLKVCLSKFWCVDRGEIWGWNWEYCKRDNNRSKFLFIFVEKDTLKYHKNIYVKIMQSNK